MESGNYEDVGESQEIFLTLSPVGTILPWVPKPIKDDSVTTLAVPEGWAKCDGSIIQAPSTWAGQRTPDLNNEMRFLRGAPDDTVLSLEDDQLMDHLHEVADSGHSHGYKDGWRFSFERQQSSGSSLHYFHDDRDLGDHDRTSSSSVTGLKVEGIADAYRKGDETRPRNMHVAYIMRIF